MDREPNYELIIKNNVETPTDVREQQSKLDELIGKRKEILKKFALKEIPVDIQQGLDLVHKSIRASFLNADIVLQDDQFPEIIFINDNDRDALNGEIGESEEFPRSIKGQGSFYNDLAICFYNESTLRCDLVSRAYHETVHFTGRSVAVVDNEGTVVGARGGLQIASQDSPLQPWVIEEGFVRYEEALFRGSIDMKRLFPQDYYKRQDLINSYQETGLATYEGIVFYDKFHLDSNFFDYRKLAEIPLQDHSRTLGMFDLDREAIAGQVMWQLINGMPAGKKGDLINLFIQTRIDTKLVPQLASILDEHYGKGTYTSLLRCGRTEEDLKSLMTSLLSQAGNQPARSYE